ncbi:class I SAM-dependent methyltransferase [Pseudonocardia sp. TRM90224]|uniref:class I SAM-dependent methyltransferase n=1 Tax=Pseudonocardia sp. TRM90224 TaxID=2812678 RepID=UPI001E4554E9|nr:SAM-dependent methyltransferase [Pseudonocardia sp. TRM90224]
MRATAAGRGSAAAFYVVNVLLCPITLLGYAIWLARIFLAGRNSNVSITAQGPLSARSLMHMLGLRRDEAAHRLLLALPSTSRPALLLAGGPMLLAHRLTGYVPSAFRYPFEGDVPPQYEASARVTFVDAAVERHLADADQFVILGAGFDTRAFRAGDVRCFEVDMPQTQASKRQLLQQAGIDPGDVVFVAADFGTEDWFARLVDAGFEPHRRTVFLWEGVIMYLDRAAVDSTLRKIAGTATGSVVVFDYFTTEPLVSRSLYWRYGRAATRAAGEPLRFGIDSAPPSRDRLAELLRSCGLTLVEQRTLGHETARERAWGGFAVAAVTAVSDQVTP